MKVYKVITCYGDSSNFASYTVSARNLDEALKKAKKLYLYPYPKERPQAVEFICDLDE